MMCDELLWFGSHLSHCIALPFLSKFHFLQRFSRSKCVSQVPHRHLCSAVMDDIDVMEGLENAEETESQLDEAGQTKGRGRGKGRGRASKGTGAGKGKGDSSSGKGSGLCFICPEKKQKNSRFCRTHHRAAEAMKYQAQHSKPPETAAYNEVMRDSGKAKVAIDDFLRENPEGSIRKRLIDWTQWKREHGVRLAYTVREAEELLDIDDYWVSRGQPRGKTRQESDEAFKELSKQAYDREGEGAFLKLWLPKVKRENERQDPLPRCQCDRRVTQPEGC